MINETQKTELEKPCPLCSICIPTYNRAEILRRSLTNITSDEAFSEAGLFEVVIADNASIDETEAVVHEFAEKFPGKFTYFKQTENTKDRNFIDALNLGKGKFLKLSNDTISYFSLRELAEILKKSEQGVVFFANRTVDEVVHFDNANTLFKKAGDRLTWFPSLCLKKTTFEEYKKERDPYLFTDLQLAQAYIIAYCASKHGAKYVGKTLMKLEVTTKKHGYNLCKVFGTNYKKILDALLNERLIDKATYNFTIDNQLRFVNFMIFIKKNFEYDRSSYFATMFPIYKYRPIFYTSLVTIWVEKFLRMFISREVGYNETRYKFFNTFTIKLNHKKAKK